MSPEPRLVLVVGPSGAGKDTLIALARQYFEKNAEISFVHRAITRVPDASEDHDTLTMAEFEAAQAAGHYALSWQAHGLAYGIARAHLRGRIAVCNVSRLIVATARERFAHVSVVLITAPPRVLAQRLVARGRESALDARLARTAAFGDPDLIIDNAGSPEAGAAKLIAMLRVLAKA